MIEFKEFELDERVIEFSVEQLIGGLGIARHLANRVQAQSCRAWVLLPAFVNSKQVHQFKSGGICDVDVTPQLSEYVLTFLKDNRDGAWLIQDNVGIPSKIREDNAIKNHTIPFVFNGVLYHQLKRGQVSIDVIRETFRFGGAYPFIGFLTHLDHSTEGRIDSNSISEKDLISIAEKVESVIIGAYDEENYVVVELCQGPRNSPL
ncbi:MAG TPA: hypothetical protein VMH23_17845 [Bacteroidota bacterium]|nr:hypothetical protein [Bacteroidota bacterium]